MFSRLASNCKLQEPCRYRSFRDEKRRNDKDLPRPTFAGTGETEETEIRLHIFQREVPFSFFNNIPALQCEELFSPKPEQSHINLGSRVWMRYNLRMASIPREPRPSPVSNRHESQDPRLAITRLLLRHSYTRLLYAIDGLSNGFIVWWGSSSSGMHCS
jgi:hypothetical protein